VATSADNAVLAVSTGCPLAADASLACRAVLCCAVQYGQSNFFKLPGGKLKPDEDGEHQHVDMDAIVLLM
jgi:hypothetical protein